jgi:hypothetical protein
VERSEVIAEYLRAGRRRSGAKAGADQARFYFGLDPGASTDDIGAIADRYPVFRIDYLTPARASARTGRRQRRISTGSRWWGATEAERRMPLPGDDLVPRPMVQITHGMTIEAPPDQVWPWLVQLGHGRAGFYSDSRFWDRCVDWYYRRLSREQTGKPGPGYRVEASDRIVPTWQHPQVGDVVADGPPGTAFYVVRHVEPNREFVLYTDTHLPYLLPRRLRNDPHVGVFGEISEGYLLAEPMPGKTRLVRRTRLRCGPWPFRVFAGGIVLLWGEALTARQFLRGVKRRAEALAHSDKGGDTPSSDP